MPTYRNLHTGATVDCDEPRPSFANTGRWAVGDADTPAGESSEQQDTGEPERPNKSARKAEWVDYAVARGHGRDDAEAMTVDELHNLFDGQES